MELSKDSKIFLGNRLFSEKTCITCHAIDSRKKAPSVVDIVRVYRKKNANIIQFLRGHSKPIVDTTSSQVTIMQANIDGFFNKSNRRRIRCDFYVYASCGGFKEEVILMKSREVEKNNLKLNFF